MAALSCLVSFTVSGHPSSGIVIDPQGNLFFSDVSRGLLRVDSQGNVTTIARHGGHWLALDTNGSLSGTELRGFARHKVSGTSSTLILATDSPVVVTPDGNLGYVCDDERMTPGVRQLARLSPTGTKTLVSPGLRRMAEEMGGIKGVANGPAGALDISYDKAVLRVARDGTFRTLLNPVDVSDCAKLSPAIQDAPSLRGLVTDARGVVYVAATGCRSVIKIAPDAEAITVLKAESPWSPSGVALHGEDIYVLEHKFTNPDIDEDWPPRIRKIGRGGNVSTLVTLPPVEKQRR